jgi:protein phosphatase
MSQMMEFYQSESLYQDAVSVFPHIPLAALVDESVLCVHGGIGPNVISPAAIAWVKRPLDDFGDEVVDSLVWSDPDPNIEHFEPSTSRGAGYIFGESAALAFLDDARLSLLVRAHECVPDGAKEVFGGRVLTVFSASNYCGLMGNQAAVLDVAPGFRQVKQFPPIPWLLRSSVHFGSGPADGGMQREASALVRKTPLAPKGVRIMPSEGQLATLARAKPGGVGACESLGCLPKLTVDGGQGHPPMVGQSTSVRTLKPIVRTRGRRITSIV